MDAADIFAGRRIPNALVHDLGVRDVHGGVPAAAEFVQSNAVTKSKIDDPRFELRISPFALQTSPFALRTSNFEI